MEIYIIDNKPTVKMSLDELKNIYGKCEELKEELHKYKSGHGHYAAQCKKLEKENDDLNNELNALRTKYERKCMDLDELTEYCLETETKKEKVLKEENKELRKLMYDYIDLYYVHAKENLTLKMQLKDAQDNICLLEEDNQILQDKLAAIEDIIEGES